MRDGSTAQFSFILLLASLLTIGNISLIPFALSSLSAQSMA